MARPKPSKPLNPQFFIQCEGQTEVNYLQAFLRNRYSSFVGYIKPRASSATDPLAIVNRLNNPRVTNPQDVKWAVFDMKPESNQSEAESVAKQNNIGIAKSDPCIELWFSLHRGDCLPPPSIEAGQWENHLSKQPGFNGYRKPNVEFEALYQDIPVALARQNAEKLYEQYEQKLLQTYTTLHELLKAIDDFTIRL